MQGHTVPAFSRWPYMLLVYPDIKTYARRYSSCNLCNTIIQYGGALCTQPST